MERTARKVSQQLKKIVAASQGWRCAMCSNLLPARNDIDHHRALFRGGTNDRDNLRALCNNCHGVKTAEEDIEYREELLERQHIQRMRQQLLTRFEEREGASVPLELVEHVMASVGWKVENVAKTVADCGYSMRETTFPCQLWKHVWLPLGFNLSEDTRTAVRGLSARPAPPPPPPRRPEPKRDASVFEQFRFVEPDGDVVLPRSAG
jgi:hypothetical protein